MSDLIDLKNIVKSYFTGVIETKVLQGISLKIEKGEFVSIMGPSGSGKSTLMNIIGFLDQPTTGQYLLEGKDVSFLSDSQLAEIRNRKIGFVFQTFNLLPRTSAIDNVRLPLMYAGVPNKTQVEKATKALEAVGLGHRLRHKPNELSGGEQQRVAIARALINDPILILADEPTGNLDAQSTNEIIALLQELNKKGHTIVIVTHERDVASYSKRILNILYGKIDKDERNGHKQMKIQNGDTIEKVGKLNHQ